MSDRGGEGAKDDFDSTCWSVVLVAKNRNDPQARGALGELCRAYWYPLYAYIRRSGHSAEDGHDLTQGFFATVVADGFLDEVSPEKGKFRAYLLACCRHYLSDQRRRQRAWKRGSGRPDISIDREEGDRRFREEPWHELTPDRLFERRWALAVLDQALERLGCEMQRKGQADLFERLRPTLTGQELSDPYTKVAAELGLSEGAVKVRAHRMRRRFGEILRKEIGRTVADRGMIDDEINNLFAALAVPDSGMDV